MFFQLEQINRLSKSADQLEKSKQKLNNLVLDAYQSEPKVKNSLSTTISNILDMGVKRSQLFSKIEDDALHGYLVPSFIDFERFTNDSGQLPEWTRVVFDKEFEKQKKSLDVMAKKIYTAHFLTEAKDIHSRQLNSFKVLSDRYRILSEHDETIDIMNQAEKMKNLTKLTNEKFLNYLNVIVSKLLQFIEEMTNKCQNFSNQLNNISTKSSNKWIYPQSQPKYTNNNPSTKESFGYYQRTQGQNWLTRANRTMDRSNYKSVKNPQDYLLRQPRWLNTYTSDYYV